MVDSVSVRFKNARVEKMPLNIRMQWNAGTACVSECVLKTLACRGLRVGRSKDGLNTVSESTVSNTELSEFVCLHRVLGRELSELLSAYYLCDKANSPSFS